MKEHQKAAIDFLKGLRVDNPLPGGSLLDAGAGSGELAAAMRAMGFDVVSVDLYDTPALSGKFIRADMNAGLPFADAVFDYVFCSETLQYIDNHAMIFAEFARLLKKGGRLVLSIPNVLSASSRVYFSRRGYFPAFKPIRTIDAAKGWDTVVYNPISLVEIHGYASMNGLAIKRVAASRFKAVNYIFYPQMKADYAVGLVFERDERKRAIIRLLSSPAALLGDHLIVLMEKGTALLRKC